MTETYTNCCKIICPSIFEQRNNKFRLLLKVGSWDGPYAIKVCLHKSWPLKLNKLHVCTTVYCWSTSGVGSINIVMYAV